MGRRSVDPLLQAAHRRSRRCNVSLLPSFMSSLLRDRKSGLGHPTQKSIHFLVFTSYHLCFPLYPRIVVFFHFHLVLLSHFSSYSSFLQISFCLLLYTHIVFSDFLLLSVSHISSYSHFFPILFLCSLVCPYYCFLLFSPTLAFSLFLFPLYLFFFLFSFISQYYTFLSLSSTLGLSHLPYSYLI